MCHMSGVMCQVSGVTCHVSHVRCHTSFFGGIFFGASQLRVCYQRGLPRLVSQPPYQQEDSKNLVLLIIPCIQQHVKCFYWRRRESNQKSCIYHKGTCVCNSWLLMLQYFFILTSQQVIITTTKILRTEPLNPWTRADTSGNTKKKKNCDCHLSHVVTIVKTV